ncbi:Crp/Fnr family transcriptional regulator [Sporolituus thermophilus]|uniref:cAMP-binding domain of CRP or a regulatory subunit of cAMP-dependent protein kinases n=1 Tax=Sporolituus thermophilus DSM 23256 TaxID=1123285 RepID=A0A1G7L1A5_9FIRM|nr:Crp/Fnr family transcriptional regulator [Sporolituus thermophilus]SDF42779.1 cAMP-binding domain of CRP or a regulatory subunit of cAMP-dependent protein kinases [Sporolituus thermophilus DSM 23256]
MSTEEGHCNPETLWSPWICCTHARNWEQVFHLSHRRFYKKKELIIQRGQQIDHLYYLKTGRVKTVAWNQDGQQKTIWFIEGSGIFGETPFFNNKSCDYCFLAETDCEIYLFPRDVIFHEIIPHYPDLVVSLLTTLTRKVHILSTQVEYLTFCKPIIRVARLIYLLFQNNKATGNEKPPALPVTQESLADILGLHRVTVNNVIRQLKNKQILENRPHFIIVKDEQKLHDLIKTYL